MASRSSSPMRLPPAVRAAALVATGGGRLQKELAGMSWAGRVWRLEGQSGVVYVKRAGDLQDEHDRTVWMAGRLPAPEVLGLFHAFGDDWLLTRAMPGVPLHDPSLGWEPSTVAGRLGEILRDIHAVDARAARSAGPARATCSSTAITACPTSWSRTVASAASSTSVPLGWATHRTPWPPECGRCSTTTVRATLESSSMRMAGRR